jgi:monofunctional biosynthetic peptidoglycan transglycosylase
MSKILYLIFIGLIMKNYYLISDFNSAETNNRWYIINDGVMGGISTSKFLINSDGTATFSGNVSPENNGGFASVRSKLENKVNENLEGVILKIKGDGKKYNVRFRTNSNFDGIAYQSKFLTVPEEWKTVKIPFDSFQPTFRGRLIPNQPKLRSDDIRQIGFLIADKQFGEFRIDIDWIRFY